MTTFKLLLLLIVPLNTFAQVKVDKTVETRYKAAIRKMKPLYQQKVAQLEKKDPFVGIAIFTTHQVDTLNTQDILITETI